MILSHACLPVPAPGLKPKNRQKNRQGALNNQQSKTVAAAKAQRKTELTSAQGKYSLELS